MDNLYIGTSGWSYKHWYDCFYPGDLPSNKMLEFYSKSFNTVEINTTFYGLPKENYITKWKNSVPKNFIFSVKGSKIITHNKKLINVHDSLKLFLERIKLFNNNLGPILWQLPPSLKPDLKKIENFTDILPKDAINIFEFRNNDWMNKEIFDFLVSKNTYPAIVSGFNLPIINDFNSPVIYIRLHGPSSSYSSKYSENDLKEWSNLIKKYLNLGKKVFAYFNNDASGYAIENALYLKSLIT